MLCVINDGIFRRSASSELYRTVTFWRLCDTQFHGETYGTRQSSSIGCDPFLGCFIRDLFSFFFVSSIWVIKKVTSKKLGFHVRKWYNRPMWVSYHNSTFFLPRIHRPGLSCFQEHWDESKRSPNRSIEEMVHHRESMFGGKKGTRLIVEMLGHSWEDSLMLKFVQNSSNTWADVQKKLNPMAFSCILVCQFPRGLCLCSGVASNGGINHLPKPRLSVWKKPFNMAGCKIIHHVNVLNTFGIHQLQWWISSQPR